MRNAVDDVLILFAGAVSRSFDEAKLGNGWGAVGQPNRGLRCAQRLAAKVARLLILQADVVQDPATIASITAAAMAIQTMGERCWTVQSAAPIVAWLNLSCFKECRVSARTDSF
jgi:hypothetical protein